MKLFNLDSTYTVNFEPEVFLLKDFRDLRDSRKKDIELLYKEMAFIYYFADLSSDFQFETDKTEREKNIKKFVGLPSSWKRDKKIDTCIEVYKYLSQSISGGILEAAYLMADKIKKQLEKIDLDERKKSTGDPVWNLQQMVNTSKTLPTLLESIRKAEAEYLKGQTESDKLRGDKVKTLYEDGFVSKRK